MTKVPAAELTALVSVYGMPDVLAVKITVDALLLAVTSVNSGISWPPMFRLSSERRLASLVLAFQA